MQSLSLNQDIQEKPKRTKVCIVGFASSSRDLVPYQDQSFEIWSLNHAYQFVQRWDRWFEVHPFNLFTKSVMREGVANDGDTHLKWLAQEPEGGRPIYCQERFKEIPASVRFPREEINDWVKHDCGRSETPLPQGYYLDDYYTSSISHMLSLAMYEGFKEIHLYGVDMCQTEEYFYQRAGCEAWIDLARGLGIRVYIPAESALCKANYVYGFSEPPTEVGALQPYADYLRKKGTESEVNKFKAMEVAHTVDGGLQMAGIVLKLLAGGVNRIEDGKPILGPDGKPQVFPAGPDDIKREMDAQIVRLTPMKRNAENTIIAMDGQIAGFTASATWAEHFGRGGKLE